MKINQTFNLNEISKNKIYLMGIATLLVTIKHSSIVFEWMNNLGRVGSAVRVLFFYFKYLGHVGVDIFLILSAAGLYFSLNKDSSIKNYYIRRIKRILPATIIYMIIWYLIIQNRSVLDILKIISGYNLFTTGERDIWYITYILILYFIYPFLYKCEKKQGRKIYIALIVLILFRNYIYSIFDPIHFDNIEIALRRTPIFLLGCYFAKDIKNGRTIKKALSVSIILLIASFGLTIKGYESGTELWSRLDRYVGNVYAISVIIASIYVISIIRRKVYEVIKWIGMYSLEIYLIFDKVLLLFEKYIVIQNKNYSIFTNIICFVITCVLSFLLKKFTTQVNKLIITN